MIRLGCLFCLCCLATASGAGNVSFDDWLIEIRQQAVKKGISTATLKLLDDLEPDPRVIVFDNRQPEFVQTFEEYLAARVTKYRIDTARKYYADNKAVLEQIAEIYKVDAQYLVSFWALESNFGEYQGKYSVIRSLATLGHNPRRSAFFTRELFNALQILDEGHIPAAEFVGGWAGAMGQNQFMPSSFLIYAQDYDGDGKKNIWSNQSDVWASIANYLAKNGWRQNETWGRPVTLSRSLDFEQLRPATVKKGCRAYRHHTRSFSLKRWRSLGVEVEADDGIKYAMVIPEPGEIVAYLVGPNFGGILAYNCANKYVVSVGLLADEIMRQ